MEHFSKQRFKELLLNLKTLQPVCIQFFSVLCLMSPQDIFLVFDKNKTHHLEYQEVAPALKAAGGTEETRPHKEICSFCWLKFRFHICQENLWPAGGAKAPIFTSSSLPFNTVHSQSWLNLQIYEIIKSMILFFVLWGTVTAPAVMYCDLCLLSAVFLLQASWWMIWSCSWLDWDTQSQIWPSVTPASCTCSWNWRAWSVREGTHTTLQRHSYHIWYVTFCSLHVLHMINIFLRILLDPLWYMLSAPWWSINALQAVEELQKWKSKISHWLTCRRFTR